MWFTPKSEAAKSLAPILEKETAKTRGVDWLRYRITLEQITTLITGFELTKGQADEIKKKMSKETSQQLSRDSVCVIKALDVRTYESCNVTLIEKSEDNLILDWTHCSGCDVGKTINFDINNIFWKDDYYSGFQVLYATN